MPLTKSLWKAVALFVHVVDLVAVFAIDHNHDVRQSEWRVRVVGDGDLVEISLRSDRGQRLRPGLRHNKSVQQQA